MSTSGYVVVPAEAAPKHQILGSVSFFNEDGSPWTPDAGGEPSTVAWGDVAGKPATFPPATHTHTIAEIDGLQAALDAKADADSGA